ncbi:MAG: sigma-54 dependent transcriptional regulator [Nitrospirota bacterium]
MPNKKILIVDEELLIRNSLQNLIQKEGFSVVTADSGLRAMQQFEDENPDIVILDMRLPDTNGLTLLKTLKEIRPSVTIVMVTAHPDIQSSVEAMKIGALDYLEKPVDLDKLTAILNTLKQEQPQAQVSRASLAFISAAMNEVLRITERLANKSDVTLLVLGESGTGKSYLCKTVHEISSRKDKPFVEIGCSAIPDHLIESELFGHEKGAFTDAKTSKRGLIEMAEGGTIFFDEIGDMPYSMQSKVLSLIEERKFRRVGGLKLIKADVRIVAATNRNLHELVQAGRFRLDLYYRLNVVTIEMPPLRRRAEDIPMLVDHYLKCFCTKYACEVKSVSASAMAVLQNNSWPGNLRELRNLMEKLVIMSMDPIIGVDDLRSCITVQQMDSVATIPPEEPVRMPARAVPAHHNNGGSMSLKVLEEESIRAALRTTKGNQRQAAKLLEITRDTLRYRMKKLGIESTQYLLLYCLLNCSQISALIFN